MFPGAAFVRRSRGARDSAHGSRVTPAQHDVPAGLDAAPVQVDLNFITPGPSGFVCLRDETPDD